MKITQIKEGLIALVFIPAFLYQFVHLICWLASEPIEGIKHTSLTYETIPDNANSFYVNHGDAIFNTYATNKENPVTVSLLVCLFVVTIIIVLQQAVIKLTAT
jgi:hypothetical protein